MVKAALTLRNFNRNNLPANIDNRIKKSKFAILLKGLNDAQLKAVFAALAGDMKIVEIIDCWNKSVEHETQVEALLREIESRFGTNQGA